jgi:hypothetical protein
MAKAIIVPKIVASSVEIALKIIELRNDEQTSGAPQIFFQASKVNPCQTKLVLPESLKEKANV